MKDMWRFIVMDSGGQYAVLGLAILMLTLSASNWDMIPTTQYIIHHRTLCSFDLFIFFTCINIPVPVRLYGVLICTVHQVIDALVVGTVAHPVQLLAVLITMMSLLYAVSALTLVLGIFLGLYCAKTANFHEYELLLLRACSI